MSFCIIYTVNMEILYALSICKCLASLSPKIQETLLSKNNVISAHLDQLRNNIYI